MKLLTLALLLTATLAASAQNIDPKAVQAKLPKGVHLRYDKFTDKSEVMTFEVSFGEPATEFRFEYDGLQLKENVDDFIVIFSPGRCRGYCFKYEPILYLLIDGERMQIQPRMRQPLTDNAIFHVDRAFMERITKAKLVEYSVGSFVGKWKSGFLGKIKNLYDAATVN
jgi:hypothetical protein